jgi:hypothetical protein
MQRMSEEQKISKTKNTIELMFGMINHNIIQCDLVGMANGMVRITDNARALKEQDAITSNEYMDIINRIDKIITDASSKCKCRSG